MIFYVLVLIAAICTPDGQTCEDDPRGPLTPLHVYTTEKACDVAMTRDHRNVGCVKAVVQ